MHGLIIVGWKMCKRALRESGAVPEIGTFRSRRDCSWRRVLLMHAPWRLVHHEAAVEEAEAARAVHWFEITVVVLAQVRVLPAL